MKIRNFYAGITQFIKLAKENKGTLVVTGAESFDTPFRVFLLTGSDVTQVTTTPVSVENVNAAAAIARESDAFNGVKTMASATFTGAAQRANGGYIVL